MEISKARYILLILLVLFSTSCGQSGSQKKKVQSTYESCLAEEKLFIAGTCYDGAGLVGADLRTLLFNNAPFIETLDKDRLEICILIDPRFPNAHKQLEKDTRRAISAWLEPLKSVSRSLPKLVDFVYPEFSDSNINSLEPLGKLCPPSSDAVIVHLANLAAVSSEKEDRAFAMVEHKEIWLSPSNMRSGTILHEFGHLFGLADIYIEDDWNCRKDFPNSIMCQGEWNRLMPVDQVAVQRNYCLYKDGEHPQCFNHEKELLSFLPKRRTNPNSRYSYRDPYIVCENEKHKFSFQPYSFFLGPNIFADEKDESYFLGLYASDFSAISEVYSAEALKNTFTVENLVELPKDRKPLALLLEVRDAQLYVQFSLKDQEWKDSFSSCHIDPRFIEYFRSKGMNFPDSLVRDSRYYLLQSQLLRIESEGEIIPANGLHVYMGQAPPANAEILVFAQSSHEFIKKEAFEPLIKKHDQVESWHTYLLDVESLKLPPGSYDLFVASDDTAYTNMRFVMPK